jgi:hypothetical protein
MFKSIVIGGESARRFNQCKDGGFDGGGKFCPSSDYLRQIRTGCDLISGVYSGVSVRFPFIYGQNREVRIPLSPPLLQGNFEAGTQLGTQSKVAACPQLAQVVTAWVKLPAPLKAAILAIVNSSEASHELESV